MPATSAIYSEQTQCHDCYRCVRECPVKAISVQDGHAKVMPERCIVCGHCVDACPSHAKKVRDDIVQVQQLLATHEKVFVSVAPSFVSEFADLSAGQLIAALRRLGFCGVSETALGAQQVSSALAQELTGSEGKLYLSSACPVAVDLVMKYQPRLAAAVTRVYSPLLAHCKLLRAHYGEDIGIVFIGPCIAKKIEAEEEPQLLQAAITFEDLRDWFARENIDPQRLRVTAEDHLVPESAAEGALYPVEGGMINATEVNMGDENTRFVSVSGVRHIANVLESLQPPAEGHNLFVELLACEGGCIAGPKASKRSEINARLSVLDYARNEYDQYPRQNVVDVTAQFVPNQQAEPEISEEQITETLRQAGKLKPEDELNCGGCGYESCRDFARAILAGKAEARMCVSYMRILAQKKANALIRTLPYGVVIVDENLKVIEANEEFARIAGDEVLQVYTVDPGLADASLVKILDFPELFQRVLDSGEEIIRRNVRFRERTLSTSVFTVEPHRVVGALLLDVTEADRRREQIIAKASEVTQKILSNVQEIAFSLGRNAAESEGILNSIVEEFSDREPSDAQDEDEGQQLYRG